MNTVKTLTKKVANLHECAKKGLNKKAYGLFKEAMAGLIEMESKGLKSKSTETIKAILAEYYNKYQATVKKDATRVVVEAAQNDAEKAEERAEKEMRKQLKAFHKEMVSNVAHLKDAILESDWARIGFHAAQSKKIAEKIEAMAKYETQEDYLD